MVTESPLKIMKNAFYFTSKALFVIKIFKFLSSFFGYVVKRLDKKEVNFRFHDVTASLKNNHNTHITQYFETMKFGQLIQCNMRNIFLEKSYTKCNGETSPRPFSEKLKLSISLDQYS